MAHRAHRPLLWLSFFGILAVSVVSGWLAIKVCRQDGLTIIVLLEIAVCLLTAFVAFERYALLRSRDGLTDRVGK